MCDKKEQTPRSLNRTLFGKTSKSKKYTGEQIGYEFASGSFTDKEIAQLAKRLRPLSPQAQIEAAMAILHNQKAAEILFRKLNIHDPKAVMEGDRQSRVSKKHKESWRKRFAFKHRTEFQNGFLSATIFRDDNMCYVVKLIEDVLMFLYHVFDSKSNDGYFNYFKISMAVANFIKLRTGKPMVLDPRVKAVMEAITKTLESLAKIMFERDILEIRERDRDPFEHFVFQSETTTSTIESCFVDGTAAMRSLLTHYEHVKDSTFMKKLGKLTSYLLSFSVFDAVGESVVSPATYKAIKKQALKEHKFAGPDFIHCIFDTLVFICERGYQCLKMGSMQPLVHSGKKYETWMDEVRQLLTEAKFMNDPDANDIDEHKFYSTLAVLLEQGKGIMEGMKFGGVIEETNRRHITDSLMKLKELDYTLRTVASAMKERKTPMALLLDGGSSVGKSTFAKILFYHYARVRNKPRDDQFRYVRNSLDEFWSNFKTSMWCVHLDDVAALNPNICTEGDSSVMEILQVINQVPYIPNQAELADKGRTPLKPELVTVSTNTYHMNMTAFYNVPLAAQRRIPWVVNIVPKEEYSGNGMLVSSSLPELENDELCDYWIISIYKVVPHLEPGSKMATRCVYQRLYEFDSIYDFLDWFTREIKVHNTNQSRVVSSLESMKESVVCNQCFLPVRFCSCQKTKYISSLANNIDEHKVIRAPIEDLIMVDGEIKPRWQEPAATAFGTNEETDRKQLITSGTKLVPGENIRYNHKDKRFEMTYSVPVDVLLDRSPSNLSECSSSDEEYEIPLPKFSEEERAAIQDWRNKENVREQSRLRSREKLINKVKNGKGKKPPPGLNADDEFKWCLAIVKGDTQKLQELEGAFNMQFQAGNSTDDVIIVDDFLGSTVPYVANMLANTPRTVEYLTYSGVEGYDEYFIETKAPSRASKALLMNVFAKLEKIWKDHNGGIHSVILGRANSPALWWALCRGLPIFSTQSFSAIERARCDSLREWVEMDMNLPLVYTQPHVLLDATEAQAAIDSYMLTRQRHGWFTYINTRIPNLGISQAISKIALWNIRMCEEYAWFWFLSLGGLTRWFSAGIVMLIEGTYEGSRSLLRNHCVSIGNRVRNSMHDPKLLQKIIIVAAASGVVYKVLKYFTNSIVFQGNVQSKGADVILTEKDTRRTNPWYKKITDFTAEYVPFGACAQQNSDARTLATNIRSNVFYAEFQYGIHRSQCNVLAIGGQYFATTLHSIPNDVRCKLSLRWESKQSNQLAVVSGEFDQSNIVKRVNGEIAIIKLPFMTPRQSLRTRVLRKPAQPGHSFEGVYAIRDCDGNLELISTQKVEPHHGTIPLHPCEVDTWTCIPKKLTVNGNCGAPLIVDTPQGPMIVGLHVALKDKECLSMTLCDEVFEGLHDIVEDGPIYDATLKLQDLSDKSNFNFQSKGSAYVYGTLAGHHGRKFTSRVRKTMVSSELEEMGIAPKYLPPPFSNPKTWHEANVNRLDIQHNFVPSEIDRAKNIYLRHLKSVLTKEDLVNLHPVNLDAALNGVDGSCYLDSVDLNTSGGYQKPGAKRRWLDVCGEKISLLEDDIPKLQRVEDIYSNGIVYKPVFVTFPKDEALPESKVLIKEQFRLINNGPMIWNVWMRMHFLPFCKTLQENKFKFACAPGMVAQGLEWHLLHKYLTKFGENRIIAGDYSKYDQKLSGSLILAAGDVIVELYRHAGHTSEADLKLMQVAFYDLAFPTYIQRGDVVQFFGSNSSGNVLTVIINSMVNTLLMISAYHCLEKREDFFEKVNLMTYGDDNVMGVDESCHEFHHTNVAKYLTSKGITYTMADKEAESKPFSHILEIEFLKRSFRFEPELGAMVCPLREDSILKSLYIGTPSRSISDQKQIVYIFSTACYEYSFYGREKHTEWRERLLQWMHKYDLMAYYTDALFPSFDELMERYRNTSLSCERVSFSPAFSLNDAAEEKTSISKTTPSATYMTEIGLSIPVPVDGTLEC